MKENIKKESCLCATTPTFPLWQRWLIFVYFMAFSFFSLRGIVAEQLVSRSWSYWEAGLTQDARRLLRKATLVDHNSIKAWSELGYNYKSAQDYPQAIRAYTKALRIDPNNEEVLLSVGVIWMMQEDYPRAAILFERIKSLGPQDFESLPLGQIDHYAVALKLLDTCYERMEK
jgi:cytochrome c-type biogenesis protein CcmH/NrfG